LIEGDDVARVDAFPEPDGHGEGERVRVDNELDKFRRSGKLNGRGG
jgi:hypothetical protein